MSSTEIPPLYTNVPVSERGRTLQVLTAVLGAISITMLLLRLTFRTIKRIWGWDDSFMLITFLLLVPQMTFTFLEIPQGSGTHIAELGLIQITTQLKWVYITELFLFLILWSTKLSICFFVLRLKDTDKYLRWFLYFLMGGLTVTTLPVVIVWFAQCSPIHSFWDGNLVTKCWDQTIYNDLIWLQVAFTILGDLSCSILPFVILYKIQISRKLKFAICGLSVVGLIATASGIVRATLSPSDMVTDLTFDLALISAWATVEIHFGIIGANLALMRMCYVFFVERRRTEHTPQYYDLDGNYKSFPNNKSNMMNRSKKTGTVDDDLYPLEGGIRRTVEYRVDVDSAPAKNPRSIV